MPPNGSFPALIAPNGHIMPIAYINNDSNAFMMINTRAFIVFILLALNSLRAFIEQSIRSELSFQSLCYSLLKRVSLYTNLISTNL